MRFQTGVALKRRYTRVLDGFRGVDLSSSPLQVAGNRATEAYNFICENGANHKRPGWREFLNIGARVNGIFPFREADGTEVLLVHAGNALWRAVREDGAWSKKKISGEIVLTDTRSQCFCRDGKAFFVGCGDFLVYGKHNEGTAYTLVPVSEIATVPTTTISISPLGYADAVPAMLNGVNMLTPWRQNELTLPDEEANGGGNYATYTFHLDGLCDASTKASFVIKDVSGSEKYSFEVSLTNQGESEKYQFINGTMYENCTVQFLNERGKQRLDILFDSFVWLNMRGGSFTVKFSSTVAGHRERLAACRFGTVFGVEGVSDRLFLSGNPNEPNKDFFSEAEDFTYFPDGNVLTVGDGDAAITGYARLSDATLAVFKGESVGNPAIYYRTGSEKTVTDTDGHAVPAAFFPTVAGTAGEYLETPHAIANLSGDVLMLSRNGVFGIELSSNISSVERYARERSRAIFEDLKRYTLADAVGVAFRGRYYLSMGDDDGICYVADSRYRTAFEGSLDTQYEWWVWKNVPAYTFAIFEDGLIFGTKEGRLCLFDEQFSDRSYTEIGLGGIKQSGEVLVLEGNVVESLQEGDRLTVDCDIYALVHENCQVSGGRVAFADEELEALASRIWDGVTVYADNVGSSGLSVNTAYTVCDFDAAEYTFALMDKNGAVVKLQASGFRLSRNLKGVECLTVPEGGSTTHLRLTDQTGAPWRLIDYNGGGDATNFEARYTHYSPVVASWASPVLDLGSNMDRKTLLGITVASDRVTGGDVIFGYETRRSAGECATRVGALLDFNNLDFNYFTFCATDIATAYTKRMNVRNFNYIRLVFRSESAHDCSVSGITLYYKINQTNRGLC